MANEATLETPRTNSSIWAQAIRAFSFTASVVPITVGAMIALWYSKSGRIDGSQIIWWLFPLIAVCSVLFQAGTNLISDYFDYKKGIDREDTLGGSGVLVGKLLKAEQVKRAGNIAFALGFLLGLILVYFRGTPILVLGIIGLLGGYFYSNTAFGYKYIALGDILVFLLMGPLMVIGSYFVLTGAFDWSVFWIGFPVGLLVTAILHANNLRDIQDDLKANVRTFASVIGLKASKTYYSILVLGAYLTVVILVLIGMLEPWALIVFLSLPPALKNIKMVNQFDPANIKDYAMIDVMTAQHHAPFGLLLSIGLLLSAFF